VLAFEGGKIVARAGSHGSGPEQYIRPHDVHVDAKGRVFVVDSGNHRIKVLDRDLKIVKVLDQKTYNFNEPKYMKVDDRGWLYIADEYNSQLKVLDDAYRLVGVIGTGKKGSGPNELNWPEGVEVLGDRLWISDTYNDRILLYRIER
jgi:streptogramin lyase